MKTIKQLGLSLCLLGWVSIAAADMATASPDVVQLNTKIQAQLKQMQANQQAQLQALNTQLQAQIQQVEKTLQAEIQQVQAQVNKAAKP